MVLVYADGNSFSSEGYKKEGYFPYIWTFAVCITMVSAFLLTLSCYRVLLI